MRALSAIALVGLVALATAQNATYLYIWTGSEMQRRCNDFVVAINVTLDTADFGKITGVEYTPYRGLEPHHAGISNNGKVLYSTTKACCPRLQGPARANRARARASKHSFCGISMPCRSLWAEPSTAS